MDKSWFFGVLVLFVVAMFLLDLAGVVWPSPVRIAVSVVGVVVAVLIGKAMAARHQP